MANVKKQAKNAKTTKPDLHEEISKFKKEWYARPYADRIKKPAIIFAISLSLAIIFSPLPELAAIPGIVAFFSGFYTIGFALGGRPLHHSEWKGISDSTSIGSGISDSTSIGRSISDDAHDRRMSPTYSHLPGNIHHSSSSDYHTSPSYSHLPGNIHHSSSTDHHSSWNSHHSSSSDYHTSPSYLHLPGNIYHNSWNN